VFPSMKQRVIFFRNIGTALEAEAEVVAVAVAEVEGRGRKKTTHGRWHISRGFDFDRRKQTRGSHESSNSGVGVRGEARTSTWMAFPEDESNTRQGE
jgi:hypothetical protein